MGKKKQPKRSGTSYKDVALVYMSAGIDGVRALFEAGKIAPRTLRRTAVWMQTERPDIASALISYVREKFPEHRGRGRACPVVGEVRKYRVQRLRDNKLFIRLPVETLPGIEKGSIVTVSFSANTISTSVAS